jgi:type IV pilus assembly protein PilO
MALPKFTELSAGMQILLTLLLAGVAWAGTEFFILKPVADSNRKKQAQADQAEKDLIPLRPYEQKQKLLVVENQQLEIQLANLRQIVPDEKEVDGFIRMVEGASNLSGIDVRRFTSKPLLSQDYYVEVPFEMELDGPFFEVRGFFDRLAKLERIVNVAEFKMASIREGKGIGNKLYPYNPAETVVAVCTITTFFSREEEAAPAKPVKPVAKPPLKKK